MVLAGGGVPQALARGHGGVSHGCRGEEDPQVLDGAPQAFSLHLTGSTRGGEVTVSHGFIMRVEDHVERDNRKNWRGGCLEMERVKM